MTAPPALGITRYLDRVNVRSKFVPRNTADRLDG